eukprot:TRINITY_DN3937_c0_g2_i1.p1 TRINITY_DN3937_c0_g2~~TRINITY_DN3937_c0_g2_i1.p1  ORF type:complete len:270 (+),score=35.78 TRINITY_DN3937_c0_g2_i1:55-864(+)
MATDLKTESALAPNEKRNVLHIDSRNRLYAEQTSDNDYDIAFPAFRNVKRLRLISCEIPNTQYVVNGYNNKIDFWDSVTNAVYTAALTPGSYSASDLANEINTQLNAALGLGFGINFAVTYIIPTAKMKIARIAPNGATFRLLWASGPNANFNLASILGFRAADSLAVSQIQSDYVVSLSGENWVYMKIRGMKANLVSADGEEDVFAKVVWDIPPRYVSYNSYLSNWVYYDPPLNVLDRFHVSFVQNSGRLYEFNRVPHSFTLEVITSQ